jgi:hypothetical protein
MALTKEYLKQVNMPIILLYLHQGQQDVINLGSKAMMLFLI